jgi:hypothetical protein
VQLVWILVGLLVVLIVATGINDATRTRRRAAALQRAMVRLDSDEERDERGDRLA